MNIKYLILRVVRHFMPETWVRFILRRSWIIRPGNETCAPDHAVNRYLVALEKEGVAINKKRIMVFGYGGRFALGAALLRQGASHVVLVDKFAPADDVYNRALLQDYPQYFSLEGDDVVPNPEVITLVEEDIKDVAEGGALPAVDIVLSNSVFEHIDDVEGITVALARLTRPDGVQFHFVDLRDHYFKYPFEMLCYSARFWYSWLNPSSHHNRFRLWDFERVFKQFFSVVRVAVLQSDEKTFQQNSSRILPEFKSGDIQSDSATLIQVFLQK